VLAATSQSKLSLLRAAQQLAPYAIFIYNREGTIYAAGGDAKAASAAFDAALQADPANGMALNNLAVIAMQQANMQTALELQNRAVVAEPNSAAIWYNLGVLQAEQGDAVTAERSFREATRIAGDWALPYIQLSKIYLDKRDNLAAIETARQAILLDSTDAAPHLVLIDALARRCEWSAALTTVNEAQQMLSPHPGLEARKALILDALGEKKAALTQLEALFLRTTDQHLRWQIGQEIAVMRRASPGGSSNTQGKLTNSVSRCE
jgi:tetratricopeptide (TPR) repeat protein